MFSRKKALAAAALTASLAAGGVAGALFDTPVVSLAHESTVEAPAEGSDARPLHARHHRGHRGHRGAMLEVAAEALGISVEELREALRDGNSIADVAEAEGVEVQAVIDALVAHAEERIEEMRENLPDRITSLVNRERPGS